MPIEVDIEKTEDLRWKVKIKKIKAESEGKGGLTRWWAVVDSLSVLQKLEAAGCSLANFQIFYEVHWHISSFIEN